MGVHAESGADGHGSGIKEDEGTAILWGFGYRWEHYQDVCGQLATVFSGEHGASRRAVLSKASWLMVYPLLDSPYLERDPKQRSKVSPESAHLQQRVRDILSHLVSKLLEPRQAERRQPA